MTSPDDSQPSGVPAPRSHSPSVIGMGSCYALGTFTDNFYKQAAILLAAATQMTSMQSVATVLFSLPFILCSAWAGWLADRMVKKHIVVAAKVVELLALLVGSVMLVNGIWTGILAVIFFMGLQATVFSPALNGSIPEHFSVAQVPRVNSLIKLASTAAVLAGVAMAGVFLDLRPDSLGGVLPSFGIEDASAYGRAAASAFIVLVAVIGVLTAFTIQKHPSAASKGQKMLPFPWSGPIDSVRHVLECRKDEQLFLVLLAEAYFYGIAAISVISIANLADGLGYSNTMASLLSAVLMIGIAVGSIIAGRTTAESWRRLLFPAATGMGLFLMLTAFAPVFSAGGPGSLFLIGNPQLCWLFFTLFLCGVCGGVYLIPLASFIQVRPAANEKGKVLGVSNFMSFVAIAVFGAAFGVIRLLPPAMTFVVYGIATMCFAPLVVGRRLRHLDDLSMKDAASNPLAWILRGILALRYKVTEKGLDAIPAVVPQVSAECSGLPESLEGGQPVHCKPGVLFLPNHPALIDPPMVFSRIAGLAPRPLADANQMRGLVQGTVAKLMHVVTIPDLRKDGKGGARGVKKAMESIIAALRQGDNVLLYPSGRVYRSSREELGANSAVAQILAEAPETRVVLVRTTGLWGSSFGYASGKVPNFMRLLLRGIVAVLANGLFFTPRRQVMMEFEEPADLPRDGDKMKLNRYLEQFYNVAERPATAVPRYFWQGSAPVALPEATAATATAAAQDVPDGVREAVYTILRQSADLTEDHPLSPDLTLSGDVGLDSLSLMEVATAIESEFGYPVPNLEVLATVGDCLLAATGTLDMGEAGDSRAVPDAWFSMDAAPEGHEPLYMPEHTANILEAFLHHARKAPSQPFLADRAGVRTRRQALTGVLALSRKLEHVPGDRLGIMLPAAPAATVVWLAALLAGKEPVMLNWTVGSHNMRHCIALSGISHAVTSSALLDKLEGQGTPLDDMPVEWLAAEDMATGLSLPGKLSAAARAWLHCLGLRGVVSTARVPQTAAVLFTSGSEAAPKAVPLTHSNLMTNAGDVVSMLKVSRRDRILAMLPPFHSFGLMVGMVLPASTGIAAAYHPNPTESAPLVFLVRDYRLTLLGATPTFLEAMLQRVRGTSNMESVRYAFVGAEKCPDRVYKIFAECCPKAALCEGYGITECSPVVSVNTPDNTKPGTIGFLLPSVHAAFVKEEEAPFVEAGAGTAETQGGGDANGIRRARVAPGESGMLLVRGKSIFAGYLGGASDPFVEFEGERWYRTGDLVEQDSEGRLTFKGRLKRFVKIGGEMISLPQMETVLQAALASRSDLPNDGKPFVAIEARPGSEDAGQAEILAFATLDLTTQEVNRAFKEAGLAALYSVKRVIKVTEIPLLGSGKTNYRALQALV